MVVDFIFIVMISVGLTETEFNSNNIGSGASTVVISLPSISNQILIITVRIYAD